MTFSKSRSLQVVELCRHDYFKFYNPYNITWEEPGRRQSMGSQKGRYN